MTVLFLVLIFGATEIDSIQIRNPTFASVFRGGYTRNFSNLVPEQNLLTFETEMGFVNHPYYMELMTGVSMFDEGSHSSDYDVPELWSFRGYSYLGLSVHRIVTIKNLAPNIYVGAGYAYCCDLKQYMSETGKHFSMMYFSCGLMKQSYTSFTVNGNIRFSYIFVPGNVSPAINLLIGITTPIIKHPYLPDFSFRPCTCCTSGRVGSFLNMASIAIIIIGGISTIIAK